MNKASGICVTKSNGHPEDSKNVEEIFFNKGNFPNLMKP